MTQLLGYLCRRFPGIEEECRVDSGPRLRQQVDRSVWDIEPRRIDVDAAQISVADDVQS